MAKLESEKQDVQFAAMAEKAGWTSDEANTYQRQQQAVQTYRDANEQKIRAWGELMKANAEWRRINGIGSNNEWSPSEPFTPYLVTSSNAYGGAK